MKDARTGLRTFDRREFLRGVGAIALSLGACGVDVFPQRQGVQDPSKVGGEFS